ncbi:hypothetical protein DDF62_05600 [Caulobacter radicis]|uniref:hypothetical protein n=1 Tax=Caulobacter radicis TaxID=2172650 RepID=UPI000D580BE4|nr:hypothetical protein [Caulobacter radicis]PVM92602.1 hypothetical protein DDF62_05600 [Caulobacter radicis]
MTDRTCEELAELWRTVFGEPPPITTEPGLVAEVLVRCLPLAEPYAPQAVHMAQLPRKAS